MRQWNFVAALTKVVSQEWWYRKNSPFSSLLRISLSLRPTQVRRNNSVIRTPQICNFLLNHLQFDIFTSLSTMKRHCFL